MMRQLLLFTFIGFLANLNAQNPTFDWVNPVVTGNNYQTITGVSSDPAGSYYLSGCYSSSFNADMNNGGTLTSSLPPGEFPSFLIKTDAQGNVLWSKSFETYDNRSLGNVTYHNQAVYVTGQVGASNPETIEGYTISERSSYILKYDTSGNLLWIDTLKTMFDFTSIRDLEFDNNDNMYVTGQIVRPLTIQGVQYSVVSVGKPNAFVAKYNAAGTIQWVEVFGSTSHGGSGASLAADNSGGLYLAGTMRGTNAEPMQFGPNFSFSTNTNDFYLAKLNAATGGPIWVNTASSNGTDFATNVIVDNNGNPHVAGYMAGANGILASYNLGNGVTIDAFGQFSDIVTGFIIQYDSAGTAQWGRRMGGEEGTIMLDMAAKGDTIVLLGESASSILFENVNDTISINANGKDFNYIAQIKNDGTWIGARITNFGRTPRTDIFDIEYADNGSILVGGSFEETRYFGADSVVSVDNEDSFLAKIGDLSPVTIASPTNLTVQSAFKSSSASPGFDLTWQDNANNEEGYMLFYRRAATPWMGFTEVDIPTSNANSFNLRDLNANDEYEMYVAAYTLNQLVFSQPSNVVFDSTLSGTITSIEIEKAEEQSLLIYPNPATNELTIESSEPIEGTFHVIDLSGRMVFQEEITPNYQQHKLNVSNLQEGLYMLYVVNSGIPFETRSFTIIR